ncbi:MULTISPECIES: glycosyltransferase family 92 protein [unclassified Novosphingobium]|uniref:glycosyltransferase family 92 protein n=1 Tax=unclassified Novosphingobium TaxID=2644732 RepID=UPI0013599E24|nr:MULTISPECIES: glycosyltransferase family 92 protein [unclassified Novosphingobium]
MTPLSTCRIDADSPVRREPPRPLELRNAAYASQFDWDTLFYDVYRVGRHVVFQAPPLLNLRKLAEQSGYLAERLHGLFPRARLIERNRSSEYWVREQADRIVLDGPLGHYEIAVQPNLSARFAGRRVLHTLSRNNDIAWIVDWVRFYVAVHGADAVLLYDNGSTDYTSDDLRASLREAFPALVTEVVDWPFAYGPQGGMAGAVDGVETPWDSDYCQTGSLQHARFRFLGAARSVLNVDIDELVLSPRGKSIFAATEQSWRGFIKFEGRWVSSTTPHAVARGQGRHGDFWLRDAAETDECPPKWCVVPGKASRVKHCWSVHNLFGARANRRISSEFAYAHMRGISQGWKENRWDAVDHEPARFSPDETLRAAFAKAGMLRE